MAFQYYGGNNEVPFQGLDYSIMQPQQQSQQSHGAQIDPNMIMGIIDKLGLGGSGTAAGTSAAASGSAGTGGAATVAGTATIPTASGGASASGGLTSGLSSLASNPWAWLAAVIVGNELYSKKRGYRADNTMDWLKDAFSGEVLHQDIEKKFLPKLGVDENSKTSKLISHLIQPVSADLGESWDRVKAIFD